MSKKDIIENINHFLGLTNFDYENMDAEEKSTFHEKLYAYCYNLALKKLYNADNANSVAQDVSFLVV
jgi:hypothetical protein